MSDYARGKLNLNFIARYDSRAIYNLYENEPAASFVNWGGTTMMVKVPIAYLTVSRKC